MLVTSWNWLYLADFASFKPTYIPYDDPSDFSFFFDTGGRRLCYLAPEVGSYLFMFTLIRCHLLFWSKYYMMILDLEIVCLVTCSEPSFVSGICCGLASLYGLYCYASVYFDVLLLDKTKLILLRVDGVFWKKKIKEIKETIILINKKKKKKKKNERRKNEIFIHWNNHSIRQCWEEEKNSSTISYQLSPIWDVLSLSLSLFTIKSYLLA